MAGAGDISAARPHMQEDPLIAAGLLIILILVLILPFRVRKVEENLEPFFLIMGIAAT